MDGGVAGPRAERQPADGRDLRGQSRRRRARRLGLSDGGDAGHGREFRRRGRAINQICATFDLGLKVFDLALDYPTADMSKEPALSEKDCAATMAFGMECLAGEPDLLCIGEMGIGNTAVAAAMFAALFGGEAADWVGPGTGHDAAGMERKRAIVQEAIDLHRPHFGNPLEILRRLGGRELAAMSGAILAARLQRVPVIVDGYVATASAAILQALDPTAIDHCLFGHVSAEPGHQAALARMGKVPLLALGCALAKARAPRSPPPW